MDRSLFRSSEAMAKVEHLYREVLDRWPVPAERREIPTRFGPAFVLSSGPTGSAPVVLLHGSQANSAAWRPDVELWSRHFRLHAVDLIGEAGFSPSTQLDLRTEEHALWLDDVMAGLGITRTAIVGTSLGGWVALDYASRRPRAVRALALICPAGIGRQKNFLRKALPLVLLGPWGTRKIREMVFGPRDAIPASIHPIGPLMEAIGAGIKPRILDIPRLTDDQLAALDMPVLAIVGGRDVLIDSRDTRDRLERHTPNAEVDFIADGYHFLPHYSTRVLGFLQRTAGA